MFSVGSFELAVGSSFSVGIWCEAVDGSSESECGLSIAELPSFVLSTLDSWLLTLFFGLRVSDFCTLPVFFLLLSLIDSGNKDRKYPLIALS